MSRRHAEAATGRGTAGVRRGAGRWPLVGATAAAARLRVADGVREGEHVARLHDGVVVGAEARDRAAHLAADLHRALGDDAIHRRVVLCSPLTLYAFLAVVRQATDSFHMEQNANEVLGILNAFGKSWRHYSKHIDTMGKSFEKIGEEFKMLAKGSRLYKALEKNIVQVEELVREKNIQSDSVNLDEFQDAVREIERILARALTMTEWDRLHREVSGKGFSFGTIVQVGLAMFG